MSNEVNVEVFKDKNDTIHYDTAFCPVCGSSQIECSAMVAVQQNTEGTWGVLSIDEVVMHNAITNPNTDVYCTNPMCGTPSCGYYNNEIMLHDVEASYQQYVTEFDNSNFDSEASVSFDEWKQEWIYSPWSGVYGDTVDAVGRPMGSKQ